MAYKLFPFHNVSKPVGRGGSNVGDDVILVQGLLDICFGLRSLSLIQAKCKELGGPTPVRKLAVDGVYSDDLAAYIEMMQRYYNTTTSKKLKVDGLADRVPHGEGGWFDLDPMMRSGSRYFMDILNCTAIEASATSYLALGDRVGVQFKIGIGSRTILV